MNFIEVFGCLIFPNLTKYNDINWIINYIVILCCPLKASSGWVGWPSGWCTSKWNNPHKWKIMKITSAFDNDIIFFSRTIFKSDCWTIDIGQDWSFNDCFRPFEAHWCCSSMCDMSIFWTIFPALEGNIFCRITSSNAKYSQVLVELAITIIMSMNVLP